MGAFHAYDIRGVYGVDFTRETVYKTGYFLPRLLGVDKVLVGRDCRVSSQEIHDALCDGIRDAGPESGLIRQDHDEQDTHHTRGRLRPVFPNLAQQ